MLITTLTQKGQATIPVEIRQALDLHTGDKLLFEIAKNQVFLKKIEPFDSEYHTALAGTLSEWGSTLDDKAYEDL